MRNKLPAACCAGLLLLGAVLAARTGPGAVALRLRLVDADTGKDLAGIIRAYRDGQDTPERLPGLLDRFRGLEKTRLGWYVLPAGGADVTLPPTSLRLEAVSGLESALATATVDPRRDREAVVRVPFVFRPEASRLVPGNTHLHLRGLSRAESDDYLRQVPAADGLKVLFISYLERVKDDLLYITNRYPVGDLKEFAATGVLLNNGEEHRHNFSAHGQGYGHVMLLGLRELVRPASVGPGLTGAGFDDRPLRTGIDEARRQGGTVIWCHNTNGHEDVPSALTGRLHALNVFDGSRTGSYEDNYYRYLNIGLRLPISTGTDWFLYDFSRVYARVDKRLTVQSWLEAVRAGRCVASNGPLLTLRVDGRAPGDVIDLPRARSLRIAAEALGRHDFQKLQLIFNGKVVATQPARPDRDRYRAVIDRDLALDGPGWFAVRIESTTRNELGNVLYGHSSPVYVTLAGESHFDVEAARGLVQQLEEARAEIPRRGRFSDPAAQQKVLSLYDEALSDLAGRINRRGK